jgi:transposase
MRILAIDFGLNNWAVCVLETEGNLVRNETCRTRPDRLRALFEKRNPDLVVVEVSPLAAMVHDIAVEMGLPIEVADPTQDAWKWRNVKRKTDRDDALKLARAA